jgi:hypothetical protein
MPKAKLFHEANECAANLVCPVAKSVEQNTLYVDTLMVTFFTTCFGLYIGHHQVYLKLTEILYNLYGVLCGGGTRSRFKLWPPRAHHTDCVVSH